MSELESKDGGLSLFVINKDGIRIPMVIGVSKDNSDGIEIKDIRWFGKNLNEEGKFTFTCSLDGFGRRVTFNLSEFTYNRFKREVNNE